MRHSDRTPFALILAVKIIVFAVIFIGINVVISHYLSPTAHKSTERWDAFFEKEDADTLFVGTSVTEMIREGVVDDYTGRKCINMGSPSQYFATTRNVIEKVTQQRQIDTIVLLMGFDALERDEDLAATISNEKAYYDNFNPALRLCALASDNARYSLEKRNLDTSDSVNKWMSWPVNAEVYFDKIESNWQLKSYYLDLYGNRPYKDPEELKIRYDRIPFSINAAGLPADISDAAKKINAIDISENSLEILRQIGEYCNSNGITFIVMISPHRSDYPSVYGEDYTAINEVVRSSVESMGCLYLNLNDNPDVMNIMKDEYFTDLEHVEDKGRDAVSGAISDILNLLYGKR